MKLISIIGTRPQFLKLYSLLNYTKENNIEHVIIHSGQHYDIEMNENIFKTLHIDKPKYYLNINNSSYGQMLGKMIIDIEKILLIEQPTHVLVYGDCNTTLAGAISSKFINIQLVHIEAGARSYNRNMPEEINRVVTDHISDILCCPNELSVLNLKKENITKNVHIVGNLQIDLLFKTIKSYTDETILNIYELKKNDYHLMTIHRHYNTNKNTLINIFNNIKNLKTIIFPIHPRTLKVINENKINIPTNIIICKPLDYLNLIIILNNCHKVLTDSGGLQQEAYFIGKPCLILRSETEWIEPIKKGVSKLIDVNKENFYQTIINFNPLTKKYNYTDNCSKNIINSITL